MGPLIWTRPRCWSCSRSSHHLLRRSSRCYLRCSSRCLLHYSSCLQRCPRCCFHLQQCCPRRCLQRCPAVVSTYNKLPYTGYAGIYSGSYSGILGYNRHIVAKREADSDAEAYTPAQVAFGHTNGGVITGVDYGNGVVSGYGAIGNRAVTYAATPAVSYAARPAVTYAARPAVSYTAPVVSNVAPAVVSTYNKLPYTSYAGHHLGYSGILGYNRHIVAKREADSEADAYTPAQVALVPTTTHSHAVPATTYSHAVPAITYSHAVPATTYSVPAAVRATVPYATGYAGHLGYGYGLRSSLWV